jgi:hypothetical protein
VTQCSERADVLDPCHAGRVGQSAPADHSAPATLGIDGRLPLDGESLRTGDAAKITGEIELALATDIGADLILIHVPLEIRVSWRLGERVSSSNHRRIDSTVAASRTGRRHGLTDGLYIKDGWYRWRWMVDGFVPSTARSSRNDW